MMFGLTGEGANSHPSFSPVCDHQEKDGLRGYISCQDLSEHQHYNEVTSQGNPYRKQLLSEEGTYIESPSMPGTLPRYF